MRVPSGESTFTTSLFQRDIKVARDLLTSLVTLRMKFEGFMPVPEDLESGLSRSTHLETDAPRREMVSALNIIGNLSGSR